MASPSSVSRALLTGHEVAGFFELAARQAKLRGVSLGKTVSDLLRKGLNASTPLHPRTRMAPSNRVKRFRFSPLTSLPNYGRNDPRPATGYAFDFVQPASDIYIIRHGYYHGGGAPGLSLPLTDVSGVPNTVLGFGGGGFWEETIGTTMPQGNLKSGEYDVVIDEHQNGRFETAFDLYLGVGTPAIVVNIPVNVAGIPGAGIAAMKERAREQYLSTYAMQSAFKGAEYAYGVVASTGRPGSLGLVFSATLGRIFLIQSSQDLRRWINVPMLYTATQTTESWTDPGPPATEIAPSGDAERFYRVLELAE